MPKTLFRALLMSLMLAVVALPLAAIGPQGEDDPNGPPPFGGPPPGGRGPGGRGPMAAERKLVKEYDKNKNGRLDTDERAAARKALKEERGAQGERRFGPPGGFAGEDEPAVKAGPKVDPKDAKTYPQQGMFDEDTLRTIFITFESPDWESELSDFNNTDVDIPATVVVDGKTYPNVGIHFRGMSSYFMVSAGHKRSLNLSFDFVDAKQRIGGQKTLNLLNSHEDPTFLHTVLYLHIARQYIPAPKANFVQVAINGESWGIYSCAQQFDKLFIQENFPDQKGARWKVPGSPNGAGGLDYIGERIEDYKARYDLKSGDSEKDWKDLITLCRTLSKTPIEKLEEALKPMLDIDGALWFLALENALVNNDGYWVRASDYTIFRDDRGVFHIIPHDANETFTQGGMGPPGMGPGGRGRRGQGRGQGRGEAPGGRGGEGREGRDGDRPQGGPPPEGGDQPPQNGEGRRERQGPGMRPMGMGRMQDVDPLIGADDLTKPLRSRLLQVPSLRRRYLEHVKTLADQWLDWEKLAPLVMKYKALIGPGVAADTRKLTSTEAFEKALSPADAAPSGNERRPVQTLKAFVDKRRKYLLEHAAMKELNGQGPASQPHQ